MATRVYKYHLKQPRDPETRTAVWAQIRAGHRYYNKLIEIERRRRVAFREVRSELSAVVSKLEAEVTGLRDQLKTTRTTIKASRAESRSSKTKVGDIIETKVLLAKLKSASGTLRAARKAALEDPVLKAATEKVDEAAHTETLRARAECETFWGSYLLVEAAAQSARKSLVDPEFKRWAGEGRIGVQIQKGAEIEEIFNGDDTRLQVGPIDLDVLRLGTRGEQRRAARTLLRIRIGSNGRAPIWAEFPLVMHRPLPAGAKIMGVVVNATKKADRSMYSVDFTVRVPDVVPSSRLGVIGIDIGWRKRDGGGIRVAYWYDAYGNEGWLNVPASVQAQIDKGRAICKTRDELRNVTIPQLTAALKLATKTEVHTERTEALHAWRSCDRLHKLFYFWRDNRVDGDGDFFANLSAWHQRDRHLWQYESGLRNNAFRQRQEMYKVFAADVAKCYGHVILERWDMRKTAERKPAEEDTADSRAPNRQRQDAGPSLFRLALVNAVEREGARVLRTPAEFTTRDCHACHYRHAEAIVALEHTCEGCDEIWDQDANAARNLLASGQAMLKDPELLAAANPPPKVRKPRFANKRKKPHSPKSAPDSDRSQVAL